MKLLMESWRKFVKEQRHYRLIVNELTQLTEEQLREFPLSDEELEKIKEWGDLKGEPSLLGSGTLGSAYLFDENKVLKITSDYNEAKATKVIEGKRHPNVYKILKVARRWDRMEKPPKEKPRHPYVIVYELVGKDPRKDKRSSNSINFPTNEQQIIIELAFNQIHRKPAWTNWTDDFDSAKENFLKAARAYDLEKDKVEKQKSEEGKLDSILDKMEGDNKDKKSIKLAYLISVGYYGDNLNSIENIKETVDSKKFDYVADLASGLTFLKKNGITFSDLKTTNVMNDDGKLIIIDIGRSPPTGYVEIETVGEDK